MVHNQRFKNLCLSTLPRAWIATVNVDVLCPDEDSKDDALFYGRAKTPQAAIDMALDAAVSFLNNQIGSLAEEKAGLLQIRNS